MPSPKVRQDDQVRSSDVYDDTIPPSLANFETLPVDIESDLNNLRSMIRLITGKADWWLAPDNSLANVGSGGGAIIITSEGTVIYDGAGELVLKAVA